jgi:hypothetical protein
MNWKLIFVVLPVLGFATLLGCARDQQRASANPPGREQVGKESTPTNSPGLTSSTPAGKPSPTAPATGRFAFKSAQQLNIPQGLAEPPSEMKVPRSGWDGASAFRVGDFTESQTGPLWMRQEVYDVADHAVVLVSETRFKLVDKDVRTKTATKMLYTEPDTPANPAAGERSETKATNRKVKVGDEELVTDQLTEVSTDGKISIRIWRSSKVPLGGIVLTEDGEGKVGTQLLRYARGK